MKVEMRLHKWFWNRFVGLAGGLSALLVLLSVETLRAADGPVLASQGRSDYQIVVPDDAGHATLDRLLREGGELIRQALGLDEDALPIRAERERDPAQPGIYLGATAFAAAQGVDVARYEGWTYTLRVAGPDVIIAGRDVMNPPLHWRGRDRHGARTPTLKGVTDLLREFAGTRFLYPDGETGIEFLTPAAVRLPANLDRTVTPKLRFNNSGTFGGPAGIQSIANGRRDLYLIANNYFPLGDVEHTAHSYSRTLPLNPFAETNPEYFALIGDQRVVNNPDIRNKRQYCISNPEVRERIYQDQLRSLDLGYDLTFLSQQDGFMPCQCPECHALYDTGNDWREKLWLFHRELAERLQRDRPGKGINLIAYDYTLLPPRSFTNFPENVSVKLCFYRSHEDLFDAWRPYDVPQGFLGYIYLWGPYNTLGYLPQSTPLRAETIARAYHDFGLFGLYLDGFGHAFGLEGPVYYVFGRMWDDPENLSAGELLEEFHSAAFREAAAPMRSFFDTLYHALEFYVRCSGHQDLPGRYQDVAGRWRMHFRLNDPMQALRRIYPVATLQELETQLARAESQARSPKVVSRLALVRLEFEYLKHNAQIAHLDETYRLSPSFETRELLLSAIDARNRFFDGLYTQEGERNLKRNRIPGWPEFSPYHGHTGMWLVTPRGGWRDTPVVWDTEAVRRTPIPGAVRLDVLEMAAPPTPDAEVWEGAEAQTLSADAAVPLAEDAAVSVRALYDAEALYLLLSGPALAEPLLPERIDLALDPSGTRQQYYRFTFEPATDTRREAAYGFIADAVHPLYGQEDPSWSGDWSAAALAADDARGWRVWLRIPYATLDTRKPETGEAWAGNVACVLPDADGVPRRHLWSRRTDTTDVSDRAALAAFGFIPASDAVADDRHPVTVLRESLYQQTFEVPEPWRDRPDTIDLREGWRFNPDIADRGEAQGWHATEFDDAGWLPMPVPAFWAETEAGAHLGYGWYRLRFQVPADWEGMDVHFLFGGIDEQAWIYLNGEALGEHSVESEGTPFGALWDRPFSLQAPARRVRAGSENVLAVRVYASVGNAGIWRPVLVRPEK